MRKLRLFILPVCTMMVLSGCESLKGPQGETGPTGNAEVIQLSFGANSWENSLGAVVVFPLKDLPREFIEKSAYFTYIQESSAGSWFALPGNLGPFGEFQAYLYFAAGTPFLEIKRVATGKIFHASKVRVIFIPANDLRSGRKSLTPDFNDYEAVKRFYNLRD